MVLTFERFISATLAYTLFLDLSKPLKSIKSPTGGFDTFAESDLSEKVLLAAKSCSLIALSNASVIRIFLIEMDVHKEIINET